MWAYLCWLKSLFFSWDCLVYLLSLVYGITFRLKFSLYQLDHLATMIRTFFSTAVYSPAKPTPLTHISYIFNPPTNRYVELPISLHYGKRFKPIITLSWESKAGCTKARLTASSFISTNLKVPITFSTNLQVITWDRQHESCAIVHRGRNPRPTCLLLNHFDVASVEINDTFSCFLSFKLYLIWQHSTPVLIHYCLQSKFSAECLGSCHFYTSQNRLLCFLY